MTENILIKNIITDGEFPIFLSGINHLEGGNVNYRHLNLVDNHEVKSYLDCLPAHIDEEQSMILGHTDVLATAENDDFVTGLGLSSAVSDAHAFAAEGINTSSESTADADADASAVGIDIAGKITTKEGNDTIIGIGLAEAKADADAESAAKLSSNSVATANAIANAIGIRNAGKIYAGEGNDTIIGIANVSASSTATASSQAESDSGNNLAVTANSESVAFVETSAIGIENEGWIYIGKGHDIIVGVANNWTTSVAEAEALAKNAVVMDREHPVTIDQVETAIATSTAASTAINQTLTLGIVNSGLINTGNGHDVILGLANNSSSSESLADADAESTAQDFAAAIADASSLAGTESIAVGIANFGRIVTGKGDDTIIGIAVSNVNAVADADADAFADANEPDAQTNTDTIADTANGFAIGIDNTSGIIKTDIGDDQVIGYGEIGIQGGKIFTGKHNDRVIAYGSKVGFQAGNVRLGNGHDYFQAAVVDFDPFTGHIEFAEDQSGSIQDAFVSGGRGNDNFELGGFSTGVTIDGGQDHDVFKLWGSIDEYEITLGSSEHQELAIKNEDAILTVKNVEAFYFGNSDHAYSYTDFA
ncbi:MAG: hypothetical protein AAGA16_09555 [Cyanobacteria bacterium P01_E01_bin.35]